MTTSQEDALLTLPCGLTLRARRAGPQDAPKLLALHGWLDNAASFEPLMPWLAQHYDTAALDLPGHGRSAHRHREASYDFIRWLIDVHDALDALGWSKASLLGHSMGASIALMVAGAWPERVERLVAMEGLGPLTAEADEAPEQLVQSVASGRRFARPARRVMADLDEAVARMDRVRAPDACARQALERLAQRGTLAQDDGPGLVFAHDRRLQERSALRLTQGHVLAFLSRISAPTLLIQASQGWPMPEDALRERVSALRCPLTRVTVPGGHHAHIERPDAVIDALKAHLTP